MLQSKTPSTELYHFCQNTLLKCSHFDKTSDFLRTIKLIAELQHYADDFPASENTSRHELVRTCFSFFLRKQGSDQRPALITLLEFLRNDTHQGDSLRNELDRCLENMIKAYSPDENLITEIYILTVRANEFLQEAMPKINQFDNSGYARAVILKHTPNFSSDMSSFISSDLANNVVVPAIQKWKEGRLGSFNNLMTEMKMTSEKWRVELSVVNQANTLMFSWLETIEPEIKSILSATFNRYGVTNAYERIYLRDYVLAVLSDQKMKIDIEQDILEELARPGMMITSGLLVGGIGFHILHDLFFPPLAIIEAILVIPAIFMFLFGVPKPIKAWYMDLNLPQFTRHILMTEENIDKIRRNFRDKSYNQLQEALLQNWKTPGNLVDKVSKGFIAGMRDVVDRIASHVV